MKWLTATTAALVALASGCTYITSTQNAESAVSGEIWYVKQHVFLGLTYRASIWHCAPPSSGRASCEEARLVHGDAGSRSAPTPASNAQAASPTPEWPNVPLWSIVARTKAPEAACKDVKAALELDASCAKEQCAAPLDLASIYIDRCKDVDSKGVVDAGRLRKAFRAEVQGDGGECYATLRKAIRVEDFAKEYTEKCLKDRAPGNLEGAILSGKGWPKKKPAAPSPTPAAPAEAPK